MNPHNLFQIIQRANFHNCIQHNTYSNHFLYLLKRYRYGLVNTLIMVFVHYWQYKVLNQIFDLEFLYTIFFVQTAIMVFTYSITGGLSYFRFQCRFNKNTPTVAELFVSEIFKILIISALFLCGLVFFLFQNHQLEWPRYNVIVLSIWFLVLFHLPTDVLLNTFKSLVLAKKRVFLPLKIDLISNSFYLAILSIFFAEKNIWGLLFALIIKSILHFLLMSYYLNKELRYLNVKITTYLKWPRYFNNDCFFTNYILHALLKITLLAGIHHFTFKMTNNLPQNLYTIYPLIIFLIFCPQSFYYDFMNQPTERKSEYSPLFLIKMMNSHLLFIFMLTLLAYTFIYRDLFVFIIPLFSCLVMIFVFLISTRQLKNILLKKPVWEIYIFKNKALFEFVMKKNKFHVFKLHTSFLPAYSKNLALCLSLSRQLNTTGLIFHDKTETLVATRNEALDKDIEFILAGHGYINEIRKA